MAGHSPKVERYGSADGLPGLERPLVLAQGLGDVENVIEHLVNRGGEAQPRDSNVQRFILAHQALPQVSKGKENHRHPLIIEGDADGAAVFISNNQPSLSRPGDGALAEAARSRTVHFDLGIALRRLGRRAEAEQSLLKAVRWEPEMSNAWAELGNLYLESGLYLRSAAAYRRAIALGREDLRDRLRLAESSAGAADS